MGEFQQGAKNELEAREKAIEHLVSPIRESLAAFDTAVKDLEKNRLEAYTALSTEVVALGKGQKDLHSETGKLVKALRAPSPRGRWGEIQLRRVVEMAGMVEHCDFDEQANVPTEDGRLRPDVVVHIPGTKTTVIDSKVPLIAYLDSLDAEDEGARRNLLRDHAAQVRKHISQLGGKAYWDQLSSSPDFVIMYVPLESGFVAALEEDPGLIDYAVGSSVIPAGPMTLLTHLKAAAYGWRQERIAANAERISELGKELYNRLATLASHFAELGKNLGKATEAYNSAVGSLERRVLIQARRFKELGAATGEDLVEPELVAVTAREIQAPELVADTAAAATSEDTEDP
jgi:DNA recombination protein RmuC